MITRNKEKNGNITLTIIPEDGFQYFELYSLQLNGACFILECKDGMCSAITGIDESERIFKLSNLKLFSGDKLKEINGFYEKSLPSIYKLISEKN